MVMMTIIDSLKKQLSSSFRPFLSGAQCLKKLAMAHSNFSERITINCVHKVLIRTSAI